MFGGNPEFFNVYSSEDIPKDEKERIFNKLAEEIVSRNLTIPAVMFLEIMKPLSFVGSQIMIMLNPFVQSIFTTKNYWLLSLLLEKRENVEYLITAIERRNDENKRGIKKDTCN